MSSEGGRLNVTALPGAGKVRGGFVRRTRMYTDSAGGRRVETQVAIGMCKTVADRCGGSRRQQKVGLGG